MTDQVPVVFSKEMLWLLQRFVRHENGIPWQGKWPITSLELNDAIAEAILFCEDQQQPEASIVLGRGDCYLIDALVQQDAKSPLGVLMGKEILLRTYRVRATLDGAPQATGSGRELSEDEVHSAMQSWKQGIEEGTITPPRTRKPRRNKSNAN